MSNITDYMIAQRYHFIAQQLTIYAGIILHILCLFGTIMNIITFSQGTYNRRAAPLYLLYASIFDLAHLTPTSLLNILQYGFHYDWTINSTILCKITNYFVYIFTIISGTLTILASINRFLLSSDNPKKWNYCSCSIAKRSIILTVFIWPILSIPIIFCTKRYHFFSNKEHYIICSNPSKDRFCLFVRIIYTCLLNGFILPFMMLIFGLITYNNVHQLYGRSKLKSVLTRKINHQITLMLVLQSIKSGFASFPFSIFNTYLLITIRKDKSLLHEAKEYLIKQIFYLLFWSNYTSFFVYIYSSDIFRDHWIKAMETFICCLRENRRRHYYCATELKRLNTAIV